MRPEEVHRAEPSGDTSRPPDAPKRAPSGESFAAVLGPSPLAPAQGPAVPGAQMSVTTPPGPAGIPSLLSLPSPPIGVAARGGSAHGAATSRSARPDPLDPATRHSAQIAPLLEMGDGSRAPPLPDAPVQATARASLEEVLPALVRRIAWSGDGKRGTLRLEFGQGALAGGTLLVQAEDGRVRVELQAPPGTDTSAWKGRIASRLANRGVQLDELVVE